MKAWVISYIICSYQIPPPPDIWAPPHMQLRPQRAHWPGSRRSCWRRASGCHTSPAHSSCCWSPPLREKTEQKQQINWLRWKKTKTREEERSGLGLGSERPRRRTVPGSWAIIRFLTPGAKRELDRHRKKLSQLLMTFTFPAAPPQHRLLKNKDLCSSCSSRVQTNSTQFKLRCVNFADICNIWISNGIKGLKGDRNEENWCSDLPVKSTFPYRSWICGARPSLNRYRLWNNKKHDRICYTRTGKKKKDFMQGLVFSLLRHILLSWILSFQDHPVTTTTTPPVSFQGEETDVSTSYQAATADGG